MASVVIVDDAPFIVEVLSSIIRDSGHQLIATSYTGEEAVDIVKIYRPDIVILDLVMPNQTGIEIAQKIYSLNLKTEIIMCSSMDDEFTRGQVLESGVQTFLPKPFNKKQVLRAISSAYQRLTGLSA